MAFWPICWWRRLALAAFAAYLVGCASASPVVPPVVPTLGAAAQPSLLQPGSEVPKAEGSTERTAPTGSVAEPQWGPFKAEVWISWLISFAVAVGTMLLAVVTYAQGRRARKDRLEDLSVATKQAELALRAELDHAYEATTAYLASLEAAAQGARRLETFHDNADKACRLWTAQVAPFEVRMLDGLRTLPTAADAGRRILGSYWKAKRWPRTTDGQEALLAAVRILRSGLADGLLAIEKKHDLPSSRAVLEGAPFVDDGVKGNV